MAFDIKQLGFIKDILRKGTQIINNQESLTDGIGIFGDRDYATTLVEEDFTDMGFTKVQFTDIADFTNAFNKMLDGQALAPEEVKDYRKILNILRTDYEKE